jgi:hypothetical protein
MVPQLTILRTVLTSITHASYSVPFIAQPQFLCIAYGLVRSSILCMARYSIFTAGPLVLLKLILC